MIQESISVMSGSCALRESKGCRGSFSFVPVGRTSKKLSNAVKQVTSSSFAKPLDGSARIGVSFVPDGGITDL
jgi:hypothetical protein